MKTAKKIIQKLKFMLVITTAFMFTACVEVDNFMKDTKEMLSLNLTLTEYAKAQASFADALGLKEEALLAKNTAENLENGTLSGESSLNEVISNSEAIQNKINEKMESGVLLTEQSKDTFKQGIPNYIAGTVTLLVTIKLAEEAKNKFEDDESNDFEKALNGIAFLYILSKTPSLLSSAFETTSTLIKFATANDIDTSELETLSDDMGD